MGIIDSFLSKFRKKEPVPEYGKPLITSTEASQVKDPSKYTVVSDTEKVSDIAPTYSGSVSQAVSSSKGKTTISGATTPTGKVAEEIRGTSSPPTSSQTFISKAEYTGVLPDRATLSVKEASKGTFSAIANVGLIGQQGLGAYGSGVIGSFYAYPGKTKAETIDPSTTRREDTDIFLPSTGTGIYTPSTKKYEKNLYVYQDPFYKGEQTYFEVSEGRKKDLWEGAGLEYTGEPTQLIPQRVAEDVSKATSKSIQTRIDTGEFGYGEESVKLGTAEFEKIAPLEYESRISGLGTNYEKQFQKQLRYEKDLFKPIAVTGAEYGFKLAETGAIIVATSFGGAGLTLVASTYLGVKTFKSGVEYAGAFDDLTTGQKVLGGGALVLGAGASLYGFKLGVDKYYAGWQKTIIEAGQASKSRTLGQEVWKVTDDLGQQSTFIKTETFKATGHYQQLTKAGTTVYQTGDKSVAFVSKGFTTTKVFSPRYDTFLKTKPEKFIQTGNIQNIQEGLSVTLGKGKTIFTSDPIFTGGMGSAKLVRGGFVKDYPLATAGRLDDKGFYHIYGGAGKDLSRQSTDILGARGIKVFSDSVRASPYDYSTIKALPTQTADEGVSFISFSGTGTKTAFSKTFGEVSAGVSSQLTRGAFTATTPSFSALISTPSVKTGQVAVATGLTRVIPSSKTQKELTTTQNFNAELTGKSLQIQPIIPTTLDIGRVRGSSRGRTSVIPITSLLPIIRAKEKDLVIPALKPRLAEGLAQRGRIGLLGSPFISFPITPGTITPSFGGGGFGFALPKPALSFGAVFGAPFKTKRSYQYSPNIGSILAGYKAPKLTGRIRRAELTGFTPRPVITGTRRKASKRKR